MAKFIIEVDDDLIRKKAGLDRLKENVDKASTRNEAIRELFESMTCGAVLKKIDKGVTEFHITRDMLDNADGRELFDNNVADILALALMADKE